MANKVFDVSPEREGNMRKRVSSVYRAEDFGDNSLEVGRLFSKCRQLEEQHNSKDYGHFDDLRFNAFSPPIQTCLDEITKLAEFPTMLPDATSQKEKKLPYSLASLELLKNFGSGFKRLSSERAIQPTNTCSEKVGKHKLSTEEIMRIAGARFIQLYSQTSDVADMLRHPYDFYFSGLSAEETKSVELAECLLASAEKVGYQQFDRAVKLLNQCDCSSSDTGNAVQRVVHYFSEALREKIYRQTGRSIMLNGSGKHQTFELDLAMMKPNPAAHACHERMPFSQVMQFTGIQAIIENVADAKKIHVIDLEIRNGVQWTALMQALAEREECCPIELLKITAVGTTSKDIIEGTGKRLENFARTLNLPFSFKVLSVPDMLDLKPELFELEPDETVAVYAQYFFMILLSQPTQAESMMRVIRSINPRIMVVTEVESNHNSPVFVSRFVEALFFFSAYFDCFDACLKRDNPDRTIMEQMYFGQGIRNIVAFEGEERKVRAVKIDVWRVFFTRYGLVETELSTAAMFQASQVVEKFSCGSFCSLEMKGKCLVIGWRGTPISSLSVWKFN